MRSLQDVLKDMVTDDDEARVDGRKSLALSGPKETKDENVPQATPISLVNNLIASNRE
jgi:hypothetical protein